MVDVLELNYLGTTRAAMQTQEGISIAKKSKTTVKGNRTRNHSFNLTDLEPRMVIVKKNITRRTIKPKLFSDLSKDE